MTADCMERGRVELLVSYNNLILTHTYNITKHTIALQNYMVIRI
jgi:hypothetical protein